MTISNVPPPRLHAVCRGWRHQFQTADFKPISGCCWQPISLFSLGHSLVRPVPRAFFDPDRQMSQPSRAGPVNRQHVSRVPVCFGLHRVHGALTGHVELGVTKGYTAHLTGQRKVSLRPRWSVPNVCCGCCWPCRELRDLLAFYGPDTLAQRCLLIGV